MQHIADGACAIDSAVQRQFDRLAQLSLRPEQRGATLGLERITALLARLGNPQQILAPVIHVAGTNGKGSVCAFLRAMLEAAGYRVHVYSSPHLVRFNERIRLAGHLISDANLEVLLQEVLDHSTDIQPSFFEATTAVALLGFARTPADVIILEVGLGGRLDATNVIARPLATAIASLGLDHHEFLLAPDSTAVPSEPMARIAYEKSSIAKHNVPLTTMRYADLVQQQIAKTAAERGALLIAQGVDWDVILPSPLLSFPSSPLDEENDTCSVAWLYHDRWGSMALPLPRLAGTHQVENAALAVAILRHQPVLAVTTEALMFGIRAADWSARLQRLPPGPLTAMAAMRAGTETGTLWVDGGHNPDAAARIAAFFAQRQARHGRIAVVLGMVANKDAMAFVAALAPIAHSLVAVPVVGHAHHAPAVLTTLAQSAGIASTAEATTLPEALALAAAMRTRARKRQGEREMQGAREGETRSAREAQHSDIAILGSLYLAGTALAANDSLPD